MDFIIVPLIVYAVVAFSIFVTWADQSDNPVGLCLAWPIVSFKLAWKAAWGTRLSNSTAVFAKPMTPEQKAEFLRKWNEASKDGMKLQACSSSKISSTYYCQHCHKEHPAIAKFCRYCGSKTYRP
jgi:ribosomal protein L40E